MVRAGPRTMKGERVGHPESIPAILPELDQGTGEVISLARPPKARCEAFAHTASTIACCPTIVRRSQARPRGITTLSEFQSC